MICVKQLMGNPKGRRIMDSIPSESELDGEDNWVIVKKQRVTILVPPLPCTAPQSAMPKPEPSTVQTVPVKTVNDNSATLIETSTRIPLIGVEDEIAMLMASNRGIQVGRKTPPRQKLPRQNVAMELGNAYRGNALRSDGKVGLSGDSQTIKQPTLFRGRPSSFLDSSLMLNRRLRASLLEKKLQKAGGLSRWLESLGLGQFVKIFQERSVGKFLLVSLTMEKLKDMGADAVGPRRKLIHAIDCICQPYCFETH